jgi:geranylgeranyl pyrophosphate synthase
VSRDGPRFGADDGAALRTAVAIELHGAFLVHDDVEDRETLAATRP